MTVLALALVFMIGFTVLAFQVIMWQDQDISVNIVSETEEGNKEVTISIRNTAGSTLLFYENAAMTGKIEYLSEDGWVEYCDVVYSNGNASAVSQLYGGTFAELQSGEDWDITIPEETVEKMQSGTYRIKMTYITEGRYNKYLDEEFKNRNNTDNDEEDPDATIENVANDGNVIDGFFTDLGLKPEADKNEREPEAFLAENMSEVFVKTFEYVAPEEFIEEISIANSDIDNSITPKQERALRERDEELQ